jgi:hypothetical protein
VGTTAEIAALAEAARLSYRPPRTESADAPDALLPLLNGLLKSGESGPPPGGGSADMSEFHELPNSPAPAEMSNRRIRSVRSPVLLSRVRDVCAPVSKALASVREGDG